MDVKLFIHQQTQGNSYVVTNEAEKCVIVDPGGFDMSSVLKYIKENNLDLSGMFLTHGHYDHIVGVPEIIKYKDVPVYVGEGDHDFLYDSSLSLALFVDLDFSLKKNLEVVKLKNGDNVFGFDIIETPGHTVGGICYYNEDNKILFTGDTMFKSTYGRTDFPTGDFSKLKESIKKILDLPEDITIYPGHGGETSVQNERMNYIDK